MKSEKNKVIKKRSPGLARPEDFHVNEASDGEPPGQPFHGQCGDTAGEYNSLLRVGPQSRRGRPKGKSNIEARIQKEKAREAYPPKMVERE